MCTPAACKLLSNPGGNCSCSCYRQASRLSVPTKSKKQDPTPLQLYELLLHMDSKEDLAVSDDGEVAENEAQQPSDQQLRPIPVSSLRPTQLVVGMQNVAIKSKKIEDKQLATRPKKLDKFLRKHAIPVVLGPAGPNQQSHNNNGAQCTQQGVPYLIDHHHLALALQQHGIRTCYCQIVHDWSHMSWKEFWHAMSDKGYVWLHDEHGTQLNMEQFLAALPTDLQSLKDDPYRSLATHVRLAGGYDKVWVPFSEFRWANWFRQKLPREAVQKPDSPQCLTAALKLAASSEAASLPGYKAAPQQP